MSEFAPDRCQAEVAFGMREEQSFSASHWHWRVLQGRHRPREIHTRRTQCNDPDGGKSIGSVVMRRAVPFTGTAGLDFLQMSTSRVEIGIKNEKKVQNHIGGIHASAMNLLAETATGMVVGMNVRDDCIPLAKELKMAFKKRDRKSVV